MRKGLVGVAAFIAIAAGWTSRSWAQVGQTSIGAACKQDMANTANYNGTLGVNADNQYFDAGSGDSGVQVICPVSNGSYTNVIVSGWAASASPTAMSARACVQPYAGGVPTCTPVFAAPDKAGETHFKVAIPSHTASDFLFLQIQLFDNGGTVWGYAVQ